MGDSIVGCHESMDINHPLRREARLEFLPVERELCDVKPVRLKYLMKRMP